MHYSGQWIESTNQVAGSAVRKLICRKATVVSGNYPLITDPLTLDQRLILVTLLIRLGVAAAISSVLVRARRFRVLLFREERTLSEKIEIVFIVGTPIALGVLVREWVRNFYAADIAFEGAILMGIIGGRLAGTAGGVLVSLPALFLGRVAGAADERPRRLPRRAACATSLPSARPSGRFRRCSISASITGSGAAFASRSSTGKPPSSS